MKFIASILILSLVTIKAYCQSQQAMAFIRDFFMQSAQMVYMDNVGQYELKRMQKALSQDTLQDLFDSKPARPDVRLLLTSTERTYIQRELDRQAKITWPSQLFGNGTVLTRTTVDSIYRDSTRGEMYFSKHYDSRLYSFSNPIFIRDHSICIFYSGYTCGSRCGEGKLVLFKKENQTWVPWIELYRWVS